MVPISGNTFRNFSKTYHLTVTALVLAPLQKVTWPVYCYCLRQTVKNYNNINSQLDAKKKYYY